MTSYYMRTLAELALAKVALDQAAVYATMDRDAAHLIDKIQDSYLMVTKLNRKAQMDFSEYTIDRLKGR